MEYERIGNDEKSIIKDIRWCRWSIIPWVIICIQLILLILVACTSFLWYYTYDLLRLFIPIFSLSNDLTPYVVGLGLFIVRLSYPGRTTNLIHVFDIFISIWSLITLGYSITLIDKNKYIIGSNSEPYFSFPRNRLCEETPTEENCGDTYLGYFIDPTGDENFTDIASDAAHGLDLSVKIITFVFAFFRLFISMYTLRSLSEQPSKRVKIFFFPLASDEINETSKTRLTATYFAILITLWGIVYSVILFYKMATETVFVLLSPFTNAYVFLYLFCAIAIIPPPQEITEDTEDESSNRRKSGSVLFTLYIIFFAVSIVFAWFNIFFTYKFKELNEVFICSNRSWNLGDHGAFTIGIKTFDLYTGAVSYFTNSNPLNVSDALNVVSCMDDVTSILVCSFSSIIWTLHFYMWWQPRWN